MFKQETHKPNAAVDKRVRLAKVRVLLADNDPRTADLVRRVLYNFGFRRIDIARDGEEALHSLRTNRYELLITESKLRYLDGVQLVHAVRQWKHDNSIRADMPVIMLTAAAELEDVQAARDAGVSEFVRKPFTAKTLSDRIIQVIDNPRVFVQAGDYVGPCRRRKRPAPPSGIERRKPPPTIKQRMISGTAPVSISLDPPKLPSLTQANTDIRDQIGSDVSAADIMNELVIKEAQNQLQLAEGEFIAWARDDIAKLEEAYQDLLGRPGDPTAHYLLLSSAYAIKSQAGIFGYDLGTEVAGMLVQYLTEHQDMDKKRLVVVRKHIDTIAAIFTQEIKDAGRGVAQEFVRALQLLIEKLG